MNDEKVGHQRKSIRLSEYDYSLAGGYFITIVTMDRVSLFGNVKNDEMIPNDQGVIARNEWFKTAQLRQHLTINDDEFVVMPNHIHGIIWIKDDHVGAQRRCAPTNNRFSVGSQTLGSIVRAYKSAVTYNIHKLPGMKGVSVWQRNYYEHIIRDERDYANIFDYIQTNPLNWEQDEEKNRLGWV
ncbi:MAG: transposase [Bellilinea sp.]